ncbi:MAG TPA: hypothetical protein VNZ94_01745 [Xanthobacteraceae bacterium]|nr:hypothetical protein [Xanthobacteraceae bacterium]
MTRCELLDWSRRLACELLGTADVLVTDPMFVACEAAVFAFDKAISSPEPVFVITHVIDALLPTATHIERGMAIGIALMLRVTSNGSHMAEHPCFSPSYGEVAIAFEKAQEDWSGALLRK